MAKNSAGSIGQNVQIETRWATADLGEFAGTPRNLAALNNPTCYLGAWRHQRLRPLQQATHTIPIVFPVAGDPVASGFAESLARPGGNITGFAIFEYSIGAKWLELLKQVAPRVTRAAILQQAGLPGALGQVGAVQAAGPTLGVEVKPLNVRDVASIEAGVTSFAQAPNARHDRRCGRVTAAPSRSDHSSDSTNKVTDGLLRTIICHGWRPRFLWSE